MVGMWVDISVVVMAHVLVVSMAYLTEFAKVALMAAWMVLERVH